MLDEAKFRNICYVGREGFLFSDYAACCRIKSAEFVLQRLGARQEDRRVCGGVTLKQRPNYVHELARSHPSHETAGGISQRPRHKTCVWKTEIGEQIYRQVACLELTCF
jgi:hypothetical protein